MAKRSWVWDHFKLNKEKTHVECDICLELIRYHKNTSNMATHLQSKHRSRFSSGDQDASISKRKSNEEGEQSIKTYLNILSSHKEGGSLSIEFNNNFASLIACGGLPFHLVENKAFLIFMKRVLPRCKVPSRKTISRLIDSKIERVKSSLKERLAEIQELALTFDSWTYTLNNRSYLGVSAHFTEEDH